MGWYVRSLVALLMIAQFVGCGDDAYRGVVAFDSPELARFVVSSKNRKKEYQ